MKYAWILGLTLGLLGCSSGGQGNGNQPGPPQTGSQACVGDDGCSGSQSCDGGSCSPCSCPPLDQACTTDIGCNGTQSCQGSLCGPCVCAAPMATWSTDYAGNGAEIHGLPDASVIVRLSSAPWLVHHDTTGQASPIALQADLDWVSRFVIASDGSLYVFGTVVTTVDAVSTSSIRVDHLSASGSLLASTRWGVPNESPLQGAPAIDSTGFGGATVGPDGGIYIVADAVWSRSVVRLTVDGDLGALIPVPSVPDSSGNNLDLSAPQNLAAAADGSFLLQGGSRSLWAERVGSAGDAASAWALTLADNAVDDAVYAAGVAAGPQGDWFAALGTGWTNSSSGLGYYQRAVVRLSATGASRWSKGDYFEPAHPVSELALRQSSMATLADSVLLATAMPSDPRNADDVLLSQENPAATVVRYTLNGNYVQALGFGAVTDATALGPEAAAFLSTSADGTSYTLRRFDFEPLTAVTLPAGQACSVNTDCTMGACCSSAITGMATCAASDKCAQNDACTDDAECTGSCVIASTASSGFCATTCVASSDCATNSFCVGTSCIPECSSATDCPFPHTQCAEAVNTEAVSVTVCTGG